MSDMEADTPSPRALRLAARFRWALVALAVGLAALGVVLGTGVLSRAREDAAYTCPMHPEIHATAPGTCPICQMDLVRMEARPSGPAPREKLACPAHPEIRSDVPGVCPLDGRTLEPIGARGRGLVHLSEEAAGRIGVVLVPVTRVELATTRRGLGLVATDPARTAIATSRFAGFVTRIPVATPFARVRRGQALASITSAELYRAQAELVTARATAGVLGDGGDALLESAQARLASTGLGRAEIERLAGGGAPRGETSVTAPRAGTVLEVRVSLGDMVTPGMPLYLIADLTRLFVNVDLPVAEAASITSGMSAMIEVPGAEPLTGTVELVEPVVDPAALVRRVRVVVEDERAVLTPGARVSARIEGAARTALVVPRDAVLVDGEREHVFVARADGMLEPRVVATGIREGDRIEITRGLTEGERVASVAAFLVDAESQIRGVSP